MTTQTLAPAPVAAPARLPETFEVKVTEEDLLLGTCGSLTQCAIARAVRRELTLMGIPLIWVRVAGTASVAPQYGRTRHYDHDAGDFIRDFDIGRRVEPRTVTFRAI